MIICLPDSFKYKKDESAVPDELLIKYKYKYKYIKYNGGIQNLLAMILCLNIILDMLKYNKIKIRNI